jgi:hypothetical protein
VREDGGDEGGVYSEAKEHGQNLIDFGDGAQVYDNRKGICYFHFGS